MKASLIAIAVIFSLLIVTIKQSSAEEIYVCRNVASGIMRYVNNAEECRPGETALVWNVVGPEGPQGELGPPGPPGPAGIGAIKVYDKTKAHYLGILVDWHKWYVNIFVPGPNKMIRIHKQTGNTHDWFQGATGFEDENCATMPFGVSYLYDFIIYSDDRWQLPPDFRGRYFSVSTEIEPYIIRAVWDDGNCYKIAIPYSTTGTRFIDISENMPFDLPVDCPLQYESE